MLRKALQKFRSSWIGIIIGSFIVVIPTALEKLTEAPANPLIPKPIVSAFENYPILKVICEFWPAIIAIGYLFLDKFCASTTDFLPESRGLIMIILELANVVGKKSASLYCTAAVKLGVTPHPLQSTTPDEQMRALVSSVWQIFNVEATENGMETSKVVKVTLAEMSDAGVFKNFRAFYPMNFQPMVPSGLGGTNTGFATAAKDQRILVLENLAHAAKAQQQYVPASANDEGSMICFPIVIQPLPGIPAVPLVLSIKCEQPKAFRTSKEARYQFLLQPFADRICLEYYNEVIER